MTLTRSRRRPADLDHRTRVGRERRARTRQRILAAALRVFAERGPDAPVIDEFIRAAGVARGTFYNYFGTTEELFVATSKWLEDELMRTIEAGLQGLADPLERLATGVRLWLQYSRRDPVFCAFIVRSRLRGTLVERTVADDIRNGRRSGGFAVASVEIGRDLLVGTVREAMARMMGGRVPRGYADEIARAILRGLGADESTTARLLALPLPEAHGLRPGARAAGTKEPSTPR
jgi:AcrR family transcriptional regulator